MSRLRAVVSIATFAAVQGFAVAPAGAASILEDVLDALSGLYAAPLVAMFGNAAINVPTQTMVTATLRAGDRVIIGYDALQNPVQAVADAAGLTVTAEQAANLQSELQEGLYPAGSALLSCHLRDNCRFTTSRRTGWRWRGPKRCSCRALMAASQIS